MKLLLFSDIHSDFPSASKLVELSLKVDVVVGAGDYCLARRGLDDIIAALSAIPKPTVLVPGNAESYEELVQACRSWPSARVLHGGQTTLDDVTFYGIGGGIPITPFGAWSYDFSEDEAKKLLQDLESGGVLISHSPPNVLGWQKLGQRSGSRNHRHQKAQISRMRAHTRQCRPNSPVRSNKRHQCRP
jgi:Icc-related predicted phosphoesterase